MTLRGFDRVGEHLVQRHLATGEGADGLHALRRHAVRAPLRHGGLRQPKVSSQRGEPTAVSVKPC